VSSPFWTEKGLHIIYLEEKVDAQNAAEFKEIVTRKLMEKRFNEEYKIWIRSLREKAFVEVRL
jgi:parvulin-like peptidyl-prolyl isomerase